jgi:hypothetical protein
MIFAFLTYNINEILIMKNQIDADGRSKGRKSQMNIYKTRDIFVANSNFAWKWMDCPAQPRAAPPRAGMSAKEKAIEIACDRLKSRGYKTFSPLHLFFFFCTLH